MESNYSNRDFERYVQENADQYRMFPSEKVWKGVHSALHTRRRWYGLGLAFLLLLTGAAVTLVMKTYPVSKKQDTTSVKTNLPFTSAPETENITTAPSDLQELLPFERAGAQQGPLTMADPATSPIDQILSVGNAPATDLVEEPTGGSITGSYPAIAKTHASLHKPAVTADQARVGTRPLNFTDNPAETDTRSADAAVSSGTDTKPFDTAPYTIESVSNLYKAPPKKISWQLFLTPTISYRKLSENKSFAGATGGAAYPFSYLNDVNDFVTHKPDLGLQIGLMARYPLTKALKLRAGVQFNINRYDIKAFEYPTEVAVINLDDASNSIATWTNYRSQSGYKSDWLKNYYFSVSVPVGVELALFGNKKTSVGVAGTIQPTYVIKDRAYLISANYKNYAKVPWLIRHVNMSTSFEAFVNYTKGKTKWQVGPQVRYQLLSSYQNKYPVKENLFDFGMKVGITLNNR